MKWNACVTAKFSGFLVGIGFSLCTEKNILRKKAPESLRKHVLKKILISFSVFSLEIFLGRKEINNPFYNPDYRGNTRPEEKEIDQAFAWFAKVKFMGSEIPKENGQ